jgi:mRNA-decapping enzyme subunit 2
LDDLCVRFIIHLPKEDLSSVARICFQVEEAQWFYEDFIRPLDPTLPSMSLRTFCLRIFRHCPLLAPFSEENHMRAFDEFMQYKTRVPVRGAILLNEAMDHTVLVKGWKKGANWGFPRGKINKDEDDLECAIREVYEETGLDLKKAGLVPKDEDVKYIQISMREQQIRLYIFRNIPMDTVFEPKTRKEISKIEWYKLSDLPAFRKKGSNGNEEAVGANANKFYMVAPFLVPLKKWVQQQKKKDALRSAAPGAHLAAQHVDEPLTEDDLGMQTDPVPEPTNGAAGIDTFEGAGRELQRLLNAQPQAHAQGPQATDTSTSTTDKGNALMALLQKGISAEQPPQQPTHQYADPPYPHAPADQHMYSNPPEPYAPHHQPPAHHMPPHGYHQPHNFPMPPASFQNPPASMQYAQPQGQPQGPAQLLAQLQQGRGTIPGPVVEQRSEPPLLHPQPLPPQVQQSILTRGILQTPVLPEQTGSSGQQDQPAGPQVPPGSQYGQPAGPQAPPSGQYAQPTGPHVPPSGQYGQYHAGPNQYYGPRNDAYAHQHPQAQKPAPQLSSHAMSLLNAFKSGSRESAEGKSRGNTPQESASPQTSTQHPAPWTTTAPAAQVPNPTTQFLPQYMVPAAGVRTSPRAAQHGSKPTPPSDSHRAMLLDMFRKAGPRSPLSNEIRMPPDDGERPGSGTENEPSSPSYKPPAATAAPDPMAAVPPAMNSEVNLPYRPYQILARPKQTDQAKHPQDPATQAQMQRLQQRLGSSPRDRTSFFPQHQHQPPLDQQHHQIQEPNRSPQLPYRAAQAASLPYLSQSPAGSSGIGTHAAPSMQPSPQQQQHHHHVLPHHHRKNDSTVEQRQKLLSLFSKDASGAQASPTGFVDDKGKGKRESIGGGGGASGDSRFSTPHSRAGSFAAAGGVPQGGADHAAAPAGQGGSQSRRDSQTAISPSDRNFLLSYLESVSGNVGR